MNFKEVIEEKLNQDISKVEKEILCRLYMEVVPMEDWHEIVEFRHVLDELDSGMIYVTELSMEFVNKYKDYLDMNMIVDKQNWVTREFILSVKDEIDLFKLSYDNISKLTLDDIKEIEDGNEDFGTKLPWNKISLYDTLSKEFISTFKDKLNWKFVTTNIIFTEEELVEYKDFIDWNVAFILYDFSMDFLSENGLLDAYKVYETSKIEKNLAIRYIQDNIADEEIRLKEIASELIDDTTSTDYTGIVPTFIKKAIEDRNE